MRSSLQLSGGEKFLLEMEYELFVSSTLPVIIQKMLRDICSQCDFSNFDDELMQRAKKKQERKKIGTKHSHKWMRKQKSTMNRGKSGKWNVDLSARGKNANGKWAWKSKTIQIIIIQMCDANAGHVLDHMYRITRMMVLAGKVTKTNSLKFCKTSW